MLADYTSVADVATPPAIPAMIAADPDDDHVIAAAVAANANLLVSGDRHLLALGTHQAVRIGTPAEAVRLISAA